MPASPSAAAAEAGYRDAFLGMQQWPVAVREIIAGGVAGATAKTCVAPLERCKILFQTGKLHSGGVSTTLASILRSEGAKGLFRGNGASVLRIVPYAAIHFGLYEEYRRMLVDIVYAQAEHHSVSPMLDLVAGSAAGATAVLVTYPLDLVRTRLAFFTEGGSGSSSSGSRGSSSAAAATSGTPHGAGPGSRALKSHAGPGPGGQSARSLHLLRHTDPRHTIRGMLVSTLQKEGIRGMYHGIGPSMYGIVPYAGLKFYVYQSLKQLYFGMRGIDVRQPGPASSGGSSVQGKKPRLPVPAMLGFGAVAGLIAQTATYPLDVVRRRMQVEGLKLHDPGLSLANQFPQERLPQSTPAALVAIARRQGWRTLYAGLSINYYKVVPSTAIGFTIYDFLKAALNLPTNL